MQCGETDLFHVFRSFYFSAEGDVYKIIFSKISRIYIVNVKNYYFPK